MPESSKSTKETSFFLKIAFIFLFASFFVYVPLHTIAQRPDSRAVVLCDDISSIAGFVWVDVLHFFQPRNNVGRVEHLIDIHNLRMNCLDYANNANWLTSIPYPAFLYGDDY